MKLGKVEYSVALLLIFFTAGLIGIGFELRPDMVNLSWFNLLVAGLIVFINRTEEHSKFYLYTAIVFAAGLLVEILGVATGLPFGVYHYGDALGWKVFEVPLILGLNWWILVYSSVHLSFLITRNKTVRRFLAPAFMLGLDALIEPLCSRLDFWHWKEIEAPLENYLSWYIIAFALIQLYFTWFKTQKVNYVAIAAFVIQVLFFTFLNFLL